MRRWARRCRVLLVPAAAQVQRVVTLLGVPRERCVVVPNGVDPQAFRPLDVDRGDVWRRVLPEQAQRLLDGPVIVSIGRFTAVKRHGLMVRAFVRAREAAGTGTLVIVGGHPGEVEGEHPADAIRATGTGDVHLAGWHDHAELPEILNASDALALASVQEQFGLVLVEAMACGRPVVAVARGGPKDIVTPGRTGWLVAPDDEDALARTLCEVLTEPGERERRGRHARGDAIGRWAWPAVADRVAQAFAHAAGGDDADGGERQMVEHLNHRGYPRADGRPSGAG
jgi:glycosyltransferase involved in cell wall biosynthesis